MLVVETLHHINLHAGEDPKKVADFYVHLLDFELEQEKEKYVDIAFDNLRVRLHRGKGKGYDLPFLSFNLEEEDFTDAIQELESANVTILQGPDATTKGERLIIADPAGNRVELYYEQ